MEYRIFYSWQSDLDKEGIKQTSHIRNALNKVKQDVEEKRDIKLFIDEATRETAGAINIIESISKKIRQCDIFVADISIINKRSKFRKTPNPNVLFELGLASESVGWNNIVLILNDHFGGFDDLPFDIKTRRAITFLMSPGQKKTKDSYKNLCTALETAITQNLSDQPKLRLREIINELIDSHWEVYNFSNGRVDETERKGCVRIKQIRDHIFSFEFESYENNTRFSYGDWSARFFVSDTTLTTADLSFKSNVDFGFKKIIFPLDRKYKQLFLIGEQPVYGKQVLKRIINI